MLPQRTPPRWGRTGWPVPPHHRGKASPERSLPPWQSEHCQNETCFVKEQKKGSPGNCRGIPGRNKGQGRRCEDSTNGTNVHGDKTNKKCPRPTRFLLFCYRSRSETYVKKLWKEKEMFYCLKCTLQIDNKHVTWAKEWTSEWLCVQYSPSVWKKKLYNEQYTRYNLSQGHHCGWAGSETAVRTALVKYCIHGGLYTRTVHSVQRCWSMMYVAVLVWLRTRGVGSIFWGKFKPKCEKKWLKIFTYFQLSATVAMCKVFDVQTILIAPTLRLNVQSHQILDYI